MVARTRFNITLYVHCMHCWVMNLGIVQFEDKCLRERDAVYSGT